MRPLAIAFMICLVSTLADAQEAMNAATVTEIKQATVFIRTAVESEQDGSAMSGSGFLIRAEGSTGYIVTNAHVITPPRGQELFSSRPTTSVYFRSGTKAEAKATAEVLTTAPERDLAVLRVSNVQNLPKPLDLSAEAEPFETMTVYIFGFPFGERLAMGDGRPPVNVGRGQVSSLRRNENDRIKAVLIDGVLNPGNSGGPVVDAKGELVGISVAAIRGANIGFAVALPELIEMLKGEGGAGETHAERIEERRGRTDGRCAAARPLGQGEVDQAALHDGFGEVLADDHRQSRRRSRGEGQ